MPMMKSGNMAMAMRGKAAKAAKTPRPAMAKPMGMKTAKALPMRGSRTATNKMKRGM